MNLHTTDTQDRGYRRRHRLQPAGAALGALFGVGPAGAVPDGERLPREGPQGVGGQPAAHRHGRPTQGAVLIRLSSKLHLVRRIGI